LPEPLRSTQWIDAPLIHVYLLLLCVIVAVLLGDWRLTILGLRSSSMKFLVQASLAGLAVGSLSSTVSLAMRVREPTFFRSLSVPQVIVFVWLLASLAEEVLTRGLLQGMMSAWAGRPVNLFFVRLHAPVIVSAAFFGAMHLPLLGMGADRAAVAIIVTSAFVLGLIAGQFRHRTGSLWPAMAAHSCANVAGTLLGLLLHTG
jgi:membrane protease YdiL (CAAX protease family)